jgi:hypothetical protein
MQNRGRRAACPCLRAVSLPFGRVSCGKISPAMVEPEELPEFESPQITNVMHADVKSVHAELVRMRQADAEFIRAEEVEMQNSAAANVKGRSGHSAAVWVGDGERNRGAVRERGGGVRPGRERVGEWVYSCTWRAKRRYSSQRGGVSGGEGSPRGGCSHGCPVGAECERKYHYHARYARSVIAGLIGGLFGGLMLLLGRFLLRRS